MPEWLILGGVAEPMRAVRLAAALDALASAFDARRHSTAWSTILLCIARLNELGRRHAVLREAIHRVCEPNAQCAIAFA